MRIGDPRCTPRSTRAAPATGLIIELCKEPNRLFALLRQDRRLLHQRCAECVELRVDRLSQNEIYAVFVAQVVPDIIVSLNPIIDGPAGAVGRRYKPAERGI